MHVCSRMGRGGFKPRLTGCACASHPFAVAACQQDVGVSSGVLRASGPAYIAGSLRVKEVLSYIRGMPTYPDGCNKRSTRLQKTPACNGPICGYSGGVSIVAVRVDSQGQFCSDGGPHHSNQHMYDETIPPETAVEQYLEARRHELSDASHRDQGYRLDKFVQWADDIGLHDMRELDGRLCEEFKTHRASRDLSPNTIRNHLMTFRVFVRWCESNEYVTPGTAEKIRIPTVRKSSRARDEHLEYETMQDVLGSLQRYEYASLRHITVHLLWHTGMRIGSARALDVSHWHPQEQYLSVRHQPETGTPLKREYDGERNISILDDSLATALEDWVQDRRPSVTDGHGREPLLASSHGRVAKTTIRTATYRATQPCEYAGHCPHGEDMETCAYRSGDSASKCPSSVSPHPIRRSAITHHLNEDVPVQLASERMNVSVDTLEDHYDARSEEEKRQGRHRRLKNIDL